MKKAKRIVSILVSVSLFAATLLFSQSTVFAASTNIWTESSYVNVFKDTLRPADATTSSG